MRSRLILGLLVAVNVSLAALLGLELARRSVSSTAKSDNPSPEPASETISNLERSVQRSSPAPQVGVSPSSATTNAFTEMYSEDSASFAANLRANGCPEETVKDILVAEVNRRYRTIDQILRPKPADQVPYGWPSYTSERELLRRKRQSAAIARDKRAFLRESLGYDVPVKMPVYAMTSSEQHFEESIASLAANKRAAALKAQEDYWIHVGELQERTKGFWQSEDIAELERLKAERRTLVENISSSP
jgi:hypothetical protein